jgi:hypothetical protein
MGKDNTSKSFFITPCSLLTPNSLIYLSSYLKLKSRCLIKLPFSSLFPVPHPPSSVFSHNMPPNWLFMSLISEAPKWGLLTFTVKNTMRYNDEFEPENRVENGISMSFMSFSAQREKNESPACFCR